MRRPLTIKAKLTLTIIAMFFIFVFLTSFTTYNLYYNNLISYTNRQIEATSYQSLNNYEAYFDNVIKVTTNIQERINNSEITDEEACFEFEYVVCECVLNGDIPINENFEAINRLGLQKPISFLKEVIQKCSILDT